MINITEGQSPLDILTSREKELERERNEIGRQRSVVERLMNRRSELEDRLKGINKEIEEAIGARGGVNLRQQTNQRGNATRGMGKRGDLTDAVASALSSSSEPMNSNQVADAILKGGDTYGMSEKDFRGKVRNILYTSRKRFDRTGRGQFMVKKEEAAHA